MARTICFVATFKDQGKFAPEYVRTAFINPKNRQVFAPACLADDEETIYMCCAHDGVSVVECDGHLYVSTEWLEKEYPENSTSWVHVKKWVTEAFDKSNWVLSSELFDLLPEDACVWPIHHSRRWWAIEQDAYVAVHAACVVHGRKAAGLPPLPIAVTHA